MSNNIYKKICGIYKITSPTEKIYIGQSVDIERRFKVYKRLESKMQRRLYASLVKYGYEEHTFEIIEKIDISLVNTDEKILNERERFWQDEYEVLGEKGLNCRLTETNDKSCITSEETKNKIRIANTGKKQPKEQIEKRNQKMIGRHLREETKKKIGAANKGKRRTEYDKKRQIIRQTGSGRIIQQYSLEGTLIKESIRNVFMEDGFEMSQISRCCTGKANTHKEFVWKYKDDDSFVFPTFENKNVGSGKIIQQYSLEGTLIKEATINIFKEEGFNPSGISRCCSQEKSTYKKYRWKYKYI